MLSDLRAAGAPNWRPRFFLLTAIWGASFLLIKIALEALAPLQVALGRMVLGAVTLVAALAVRREGLPRIGRVWGHLAVTGALLNAIPFSLFAYAEQQIPSALASICNATTPLFTVAVALIALPEERPTRRRIAGLVVGFVGVLVVLGVWNGMPRSAGLGGALMALGAAVCYGLGGAYIRRYLSRSTYSILALSAGQLLAGSAELAIVAPLLTKAPAHLPLLPVLAVAALGALGTGLAYVLQYGLIRDAGATVASTVTYFIPIVSIVIGVLVLGERLTWHAVVGTGVIAAGAVLARRA